MDKEEFARILVEEFDDKGDGHKFLKDNGINPSNLNDADEIWKAFVRFNLETGGTKSNIVHKYWQKISEESIVKNRRKLLDSIENLKGLDCYKNFTKYCPLTYTRAGGFNGIECMDKEKYNNCPVFELTAEIAWHRKHYDIAKIIVECAKRLLIEHEYVGEDGNLNSVVNGICQTKQKKSTEEYLEVYKNINGYGNPPKAIDYMLSLLSSPVHGINHWSGIDLQQLTPLDTHVIRLANRFGFLTNNNDSRKEERIKDGLKELYPQEPRKLDFALYMLGAESETNICGKKPDCKRCEKELSKIYNACPFKARKHIQATSI